MVSYATFGDRSGMLFAVRGAISKNILTLILLTGSAVAQGTAVSSPTSPTAATSSAGDRGNTGDGREQAGEPGQAPTGGKSSNWLWTLTLRNRTGWRTERPRTLQMSRQYLEAKGVYRIDANWSLTLEGRAHYDPIGRLGYPKRLWLDPRQLLLDGRVGRADLKLGLQQVVWGEADGLRVLDVINPLDYREFILEDFLDSRRPLWMARGDLPVGDGSLQLIWVPYFAPGRLPVGRDEFATGLFGPGGLATSPGAGLSPPVIELVPTRRPGYRPDSWQGGLRYRRTFGSWDLTANYFRGWEDLPTPYLGGSRSTPDSAPSILVSPRHERKEVLGGTATNSFGSLVVRLEAGLNPRVPLPVSSVRHPDGFARGTRFSGVAGVDYSARPWLWISGQYFIQTNHLASTTQAATRDPQPLFSRQSHLISFYLRTNFFRETLRPEIFILTGVNERQHLVRPRVIKVLSDHWTIGAGVDLLGGTSRSILGSFAGRDRVVIELKWIW